MNMDIVNGVMSGVTFFGNELRLPREISVKQSVESLQAGLAMIIGTIASMNSGYCTPHCHVCRPPMETPMTARR